MEKIFYIDEAGFYQIIENELRPVTIVDYNQEWLQVTGPCHVKVINGKVDRITYVDPNKPFKDISTCQHEWQIYNGIIESYYYCTLCDDIKE